MLLSNRDGMKVEERGHHSHATANGRQAAEVCKYTNPDPIPN
jgi:hypothetical protein